MTDVRQLPEAFLLKMQELLGEEFGQYLESFKEEWKPGLRVNTLKSFPGNWLNWCRGTWSRCRGQTMVFIMTGRWTGRY